MYSRSSNSKTAFRHDFLIKIDHDSIHYLALYSCTTDFTTPNGPERTHTDTHDGRARTGNCLFLFHHTLFSPITHHMNPPPPMAPQITIIPHTYQE